MRMSIYIYIYIYIYMRWGVDHGVRGRASEGVECALDRPLQLPSCRSSPPLSYSTTTRQECVAGYLGSCLWPFGGPWGGGGSSSPAPILSEFPAA